ncbi:MAG: DUF6206 family protein [Bacteroidota bacterium]
MDINEILLEEFELGLDTQNLSLSKIPAELIAYGEISAIFELQDMPGIIFKRMPLFSDFDGAKKYENKYNLYCQYLRKAGINLPEEKTIIVKKSDKLTVLYIAQKKCNSDRLGNKIIHQFDSKNNKDFVERIVDHIYQVWEYNRNNKEIELAIDSQISNWVFSEKDGKIYYLDTSTPLFKIKNEEQMEPELILASAPSFARAIIRRFFLDDVMNRYYDEKMVNIDLVANLYKEQKSDLIPTFLEIINQKSEKNISEKEISNYYKEDKFIWQLFLSMRKLDRWLYKFVYKKQYEFILPGKIKR